MNKPNCPNCNDTGYVSIDSRTARECECLQQKRLEKLFQSSQITPAFREKTFTNFDPDRPEPIRKAFEKAKSYGLNGWLSLLGQPGSGKTHLSMAVCNELINKGVPVLYFQHVEGMKEFVSMLSEKRDISPKKERMKQVDVLYWDDLFKPPKEPTSFEIDLAFEVLNYRYLNLRPTIISSERTPNELLAIDEALGSRILERSKGHLAVIQGIECNYRLKDVMG